MRGIFATKQGALKAQDPGDVVQISEAATSGVSRRVLMIGAWFLTLFACSQILMFPFGRDQGVYAVIADRMLAGGMPYRDAWDIHPPGVFFAYALAEWLFGHRMVALRALEVAGLLSLYFPFRTIGRSLYGSWEVGIITWALAALAYAMSEYWYTGQSESFGAILTVWAVSASVDPTSTLPRFGAWIAMGLLFGLCFLLKPQLALTALPCAAYAGWLEWRRTRKLFCAGTPVFIGAVASAAPIAACVGWLWFHGAWGAMYETYTRYAPYYTALRWTPKAPVFGAFTIWAVTPGLFVRRLPAIVLVGLAAAGLLRQRTMHRRAAALLLGTAIVLQLLAVGIAGKLFEYHYFAALFLTVIVAGDGLAKLWNRYANGSYIGAVTLFALVAGLGFMLPALTQNPRPETGGTQFWKRSATRTAWLFGIGPRLSKSQLDEQLYNLYGTNLSDYEEAATFVDGIARPEDSIFIWGSESVIYWLAVRRPASHFVHDFPLRVDWDQERSRAGLMRELEESHPVVIIVETGDFAPDIVGNGLDSMESLQTFSQLEDYLSKYFEPTAKIGKLFILRRRFPISEGRLRS
jgi:Dolichyl-phosphate-mannose-protein mannosyltransferase